MNGKRGYTLLEILIVMGLLALLLVGALVGWRLQLSKARDAQRKANLGEMKTALRGYYEDHGRFPGELEMSCGSTILAPDLEVVPCDPTNNGNNVYDYQSDAPNQFVIYTRLEYEGDRAIKDVGCNGGCGSSSQYNYYVSSDNVTVGSGGEEGILPVCPSANAPENERYCFANECGSCCPGTSYRCSRTGTKCLYDATCVGP